MEQKYILPTKVNVRRISRYVAKKLIEKNHYSHLYPPTAGKFDFGVYYEEDSHPYFDVTEKLIGCVVYSTPIGFRSASSIADGLDQGNTLELVRLWIEDGYGKNIESYAISQTFKLLKDSEERIKALVSYADPEQGHVGTIYQATNWLYQGTGSYNFNPYYYKTSEDEEWKHSRNTTVGATTLSAEELYDFLGRGYWRKEQTRKHKYIYFLCNKAERRKFMRGLKHPILPYPKEKEKEICKIEYVDKVDGNLIITEVA